jgi:hypothetical protein
MEEVLTFATANLVKLASGHERDEAMCLWTSIDVIYDYEK